MIETEFEYDSIESSSTYVPAVTGTDPTHAGKRNLE